MTQLFAMTNTHGDAWQASLPMESQEDWEAHASFMDALVDDGFVILGGPLQGTPDVLLIIRAKTPDEIVERLSADPWVKRDLLRLGRMTPWTVRLGSLP